MRAAAGALACLVAACSPGVGRDPVFPDAAVPPEAGVRDAGFVDAGFVDAGPRDVPVFLPDSGTPPSFPFTGTFGILNDSNPLFAREVQGLLHVVVGDFPYTYVGSIDEAGVVDLVSTELTASGCEQPRLYGTYSRADALYSLTHETCNGQLEPLSSRIQGGFQADFDTRLSGEYEVSMQVTSDVTACFGLGPVAELGVWGVELLSDRSLAVFVAHDPVGPPAVYFGRAQQDLSSFTATHHLDANSTGSQMAMQAQISAFDSTQPVRLTGTRDVFLAGGCTFTVAFEATRVAAP